MNKELYIGTGDKNGFYTLRIFSIDPSTGWGSRDEYIKNLSTDWDTAERKAIEVAKKMGVQYNGCYFPLDEFGKLRGDAKWKMILNVVDPDIVPFGKYRGKTIQWVMNEDQQYLLWLIENISNTKDENIPFRVNLACELSVIDFETSAERNARFKKEQEEQLANAEPVPVSDQRMKFTGHVVHTRSDVQSFGYHETYVTKCLFIDDRGFKLWGTLPTVKDEDGNVIHWDKENHIEFMAKVQVSDTDEKFGFFSRPTKGKLIQ